MSRIEESFNIISRDHASAGFHEGSPVNIKNGNVKNLLKLLDEKVEIDRKSSFGEISFYYNGDDHVSIIPLKGSKVYSDKIVGYELIGNFGLKIFIDDHHSGHPDRNVVGGDYELSQGITIKVSSNYGGGLEELSRIVNWTGNSVYDYYDQLVKDRVG